MGKTSTDTATVADLEERVRAGDTTIGPDDLQAAAARERHAVLLAEARSRAEHDRLEAERAQQIADLRADIDRVEDTIDDQLAAVDVATRALTELVAALQARGAIIAGLGQRARDLGISELVNGDTADSTALGWRRDPSTRTVTGLRAGDRILNAVDPAAAVRRLLHEFHTAHSLNADGKMPHRPLVELLAGQDHMITPKPTVAVRLARPWSSHRPGQIVHVDPELARWLRERQGATAA